MSEPIRMLMILFTTLLLTSPSQLTASRAPLSPPVTAGCSPPLGQTNLLSKSPEILSFPPPSTRFMPPPPPPPPETLSSPTPPLSFRPPPSTLLMPPPKTLSTPPPPNTLLTPPAQTRSTSPPPPFFTTWLGIFVKGIIFGVMILVMGFFFLPGDQRLLFTLLSFDNITERAGAGLMDLCNVREVQLVT